MKDFTWLLENAPSTHGVPVEILAPYTGKPLAKIPQWTAEDVGTAFERARRAQPAWAAAPVRDRRAVVRRLVHLLQQHRETVFDVLQYETGKARIDAVSEFGEAVLGSVHHARQAERLLAARRHRGALPGLTKTAEIRHPQGVVAVIAPWNFPLALAVIDAVPALLAGNAVIVKPDNQTALSTLLLDRLLAEAGCPAGVFQVCTGDPAEIGDALIDGADYVAFTGSTATGRRIAARAGSRLIGASLELGGKNPMIVLADADLNRAARAVLRGSFANAGQLCMTAERLYVQSTVYEQFLEMLREQVRGVRLGAALDFSKDVGSLTTPAVLDRVRGYVDQARASGATIVAGGRSRPGLGPLFYEPTVLTDVGVAARLHREEVFGPVVSVYPFGDIPDVLAQANDSEYGLTASVWTRDARAGEQLAARIEAGGVGVNDCYSAAFASHPAPMGGWKASGLGRRHGEQGLLRYTESQTVATQRLVSMDNRFGLPRSWYGRLVAEGTALLGRVSGRRS